MNASPALNTTASLPVTPVADAVLAPGQTDGGQPLFAQVLGQAPASETEASEAPEAAGPTEAPGAALAPWPMALDLPAPSALPFAQAFARLPGAASEAGAEGPPAAEGEAALAAAGATGAVRDGAPPALSGLFAAPRALGTAGEGAPAPAPLAHAPRGDALAEPSPAAAPVRSLAEAAARALPPEAAVLAAQAARPARAEALAPVDGFATVFNANAGSQASAANDPVLRLDPARSELWQRPLSQALGERVQWQSLQGIDQARIRLDPPALGRIEIVVRQEGAQLQVQLTASSPEVARQLQHMGEGLRQELSQRQGQGVQVQVHDSGTPADPRGQQRQGRQEREDATPGQALQGDHEAARHFTLA